MKGETTIKLSWTSRSHNTKINVWSLTLLLEWNESYFGKIKVWEYIWICMLQISKKFFCAALVLFATKNQTQSVVADFIKNFPFEISFNLST